MTVGTGNLRFEAVPNWPNVPDEVGLIEGIGVAVDSTDRVYVFARAEIPVTVYDTAGNFLHGWGQGQFVRPHGISIADDDSIYLVDDKGHSVRQFTGDGELIQTIGPAGHPSDTHVAGFDYRTIRPEGGPPFNLPTNLIVGPSGDLFITDGYGNAKIHRFTAEGIHVASWGTPGSAPGQFNVPHGIGCDGKRLYVADRENSRVQIFSPDGELLEMWENLARPAQVHVDREQNVWVFELGFHTGMFPWNPVDKTRPSGRMSVFDTRGTLLTRWGGDLPQSSHGKPALAAGVPPGDLPQSSHGKPALAAGVPPGDLPQSEQFYAPHDVFLDSKGDVYTAEVKAAAAEFVGDDTTHLPSIRKFKRVDK